MYGPNLKVDIDVSSLIKDYWKNQHCDLWLTWGTLYVLKTVILWSVVLYECLAVVRVFRGLICVIEKSPDLWRGGGG